MRVHVIMYRAGLRRWQVAMTAIVGLIVVLAGGCGPGLDDQGQVPRASDCAKVEKVKPPTDAKITALVVDNTASAVIGDLPPRVRAELRQAQGRGDQMALIAVDGAGKQPRVVRTIALEPNPGVNSEAADKARLIVLDCVAQWARDGEMLPTAQGSAVLDAVAAAARQSSETVIVISDGVNNVGQFDLNELRFDMAPCLVADELGARGALAAELKDTKIVWTGLAETTQALPQPTRNYLTEVWTEVLRKAGATVEFDQQTGSRRESPKDLPTDPLTVPEVKKLSLACGVQRSIPSALLFDGDSAELQPGSEELLRVVADELSAQRTSYSLVEGHTAAYGPEDGRQRLSVERATAVADALVSLGADRSRLEMRGHGSSRPLVDEFPGGVHSKPSAASNRRVEIIVGSRGCGR